MKSDEQAAFRAPGLLSLVAAPTFAFMAAFTCIVDGGAHETMWSAVSHAPALNGMVPMYVLMSAFHCAPWLKLISRWRSGARAAGPRVRTGISRPFAEQRCSHGVRRPACGLPSLCSKGENDERHHER